MRSWAFFVKTGLQTESVLAQKLWKASRVLEVSPFSPELLAHTEAQIDFILEMYVKDNPDAGWKLVRPGEQTKTDQEIAAEWETRLKGSARDDFLRRSGMPSAKVLEAVKRMNSAANFLLKAAGSSGANSKPGGARA